HVKFIILCLCWYLSSALSSNTGKVILSHHRLPVSLTLYQFGFISLFTYIITQRPFNLTKLKTFDKHVFKSVSPMALFQIGGHVLTSMAISRVPVSTVHTIKALSPLFTVLSYKFLFRVNYSTQTYLSLLPLTLGVMLAMSFDMSLLNTGGLIYAFLSTFVFVSQNIFCKKLLPSETQKLSSQKLDKLNLLFYSSLMAFTSMIPLWFYSDFGHIWNLIFVGTSVERPVGFSLYILSNGFVHFAQNLVAFAILAATSPVTYSIASLTKRIAVICLAIVYFKQSIHFIQMVGIVLTGVGLYLYNKSKQDVNKGEIKVRRDEALRDYALPTTKSEEKFLSGKDSP
ncbi:TPT-domain-containing protein, partial [Wallemia mellicola CBS 633.66]